MTIGMLTFSFFRKTIVSLGKRRRKIDNLNSSFFKNGRFSKPSFFKTLVLIKFVVSLTIVTDDPSLTTTPSLTIVNEERNPTWTYHWVVFKKISRSFSSPHNFLNSCKTTLNKLACIFFQKRPFLKSSSFHKRSLTTTLR